MTAKKKRKPQGGKPQGHCCRICGEYKANEKFSGKGHAAHICMACMKLTPAERSEQETLNRIERVAFQHSSPEELKWLRNRMKDSRPAVREAAREAHSIKFPRYERDQIKKGLTSFSLELFIHDTIWDMYGDEVFVHSRVLMDDTGAIRCIDYAAPENERQVEVVIDRQDARRFLKSVIHELDALFWDEDLSDAGSSDDPYLDILPEYRPDYGLVIEDDEDEKVASEHELSVADREPLWSLCLELNNGVEKAIAFYNQMHDEPQTLFWSLMECFETDDDDYDMEDGGE